VTGAAPSTATTGSTSIRRGASSRQAHGRATATRRARRAPTRSTSSLCAQAGASCQREKSCCRRAPSRTSATSTSGCSAPTPRASPTYTHRQVATPVHASLRRTRDGRYELRLSIRSRVALPNAQSGYDFAWYEPGTRFENHGDYRTESNIAAGQTISTSTCPLPAGYIHGTVSLFEPNEPYKHKSEIVYAYKYEKTGVLVGSFAVRVPGAARTPRPERERPSPLASCSARVLRPRG
jgi:hypothetical protein